MSAQGTLLIPPKTFSLFREKAITGVFYGPHSGFEHFWIRNAEDIAAIMEDGLHPRVYISKGKHASYPVEGSGKFKVDSMLNRLNHTLPADSRYSTSINVSNLVR